ncbi:uncharacterized protein LOC142320463 [Lycorma delicatula]|uniref:uncharacterized protein LOC142320463 n=1 Tax=Lycorma delicatula TaxID=130591 RepID=UPI003F519C80
MSGGDDIREIMDGIVDIRRCGGRLQRNRNQQVEAFYSVVDLLHCMHRVKRRCISYIRQNEGLVEAQQRAEAVATSPPTLPAPPAPLPPPAATPPPPQATASPPPPPSPVVAAEAPTSPIEYTPASPPPSSSIQHREDMTSRLRALLTARGRGVAPPREYHERHRMVARRLSLHRDNDRVGEEAICPICLSNRVDVSFTPCGHHFCEVCAIRVLSDYGRCALCRGVIISYRPMNTSDDDDW